MRRRDFLTTGGAAAAGLALSPNLVHGILDPRAFAPSGPRLRVGDPYSRDLATAALDAATSAGAGYADVRVSTNRSQNVSTREQLVTGLSDSETSGLGVRVLVDGTWGFAASRILTNESAVEVARTAVAQARANRAAQRRPVELAPIGPAEEGEWRSPIEIDPFDVSIEDKVGLMLQANEAATRVQGARFASSSMSFIREEKFFASTDGIITDQTVYRCWPRMTVSAVAADGSDFQSRQSTPLQPMGLGYEYIRDADLIGNAPLWAEEAVQKLSARSVDPGLWDLVLLPSHLFLTLHESIAHPTELDRIQGFEANYAGTSFIYPNEERDVTLDELVGEVDKGILIEGRGSYSIDQQRYNAQFGGQVFYEIRNGRIEGMLKDVSYQIRTPEFWNSMDQIGGPSTYQLGGTFGDGKGQPGQANAVSHGCPASRFRDVTVINTARGA